jgi:hypothetical protein
MARFAQAHQAEQLPLQKTWTQRVTPQPEFRRRKPLCAGCREREARYGFQDPDAPTLERPRTLCFECFRLEIDRRQGAEEQKARDWNAVQGELPLEDKLKELARRRGRAQIAARRALGA